MSRILVFMLMMSTYTLASGGNAGHTDTDIIQRTVNFLLFAGLIWYLVAEPAKSYFASRSQSIADEMKKVQDKLKETASLKKEAQAKVLVAEKFASDLVVSSKKENKIISDNILAQCETDMEIIAKQQASLMEFEQRKMVRSVVETILNDVLSQSDDSFDKETMANVILKKVA